MTDAELDAMLRTHAESQASAIEDDARVAATYRARSYVPELVAEVRRLNAENERLSLALALQQELADGYRAGIYGDPEPRGMSDAGLNAYHDASSFRRWATELAQELEQAIDGTTQANDAMRDTMEGR